MSNEKKQGFTDEAALEDKFEITKYIDGLTAFIKSCNTPMTISIQGEWGTGKTSIMKIIDNGLNIDGSTHNIWFNTWQFSQFSMDNDLAYSLFSCLLSELKMSAEQKSKMQIIAQSIRLAGKAGKEFALSYLDNKLGGRTSENAEKILNKLQGNFDESNSAKAIMDLKNEFEKCIKETLENTNKERIVVFIDDLDRLEPRKAVELLEVLKLFFDCKNCVFMLAVDYGVVTKGVAAKYGNDMTEDKGRSFFDKIIQVPFKMPVAEYNIRNYVVDCFAQIGMPCPANDADVYIDLIKRSIGTNPRSMKRLFNSYLLLTIVVSKETLENDKNKQLLFAILCMQYSFEKIYNYIVVNHDLITNETLNILECGSLKEINRQLEGFEFDENEIERFQSFMKSFINAIDSDKDHQISDDELKNLSNVLGISTITASNDDQGIKKVREVSSISDMDLDGKDPAELEHILEKIVDIDSRITYSFRNTTPGHVIIKNATGKTFTDIYMRKKFFLMDCWAKSKKAFNQPEVQSILTKYNLKIQENGTYVGFKVYDEETLTDYLVVGKACHDSYF